MKLIVGLGNPGEKYKKTRHNIGFMTVDKIAANFEFPVFSLQEKFNAEISEKSINGGKIILAKPQTFMNESGKAVRAIANYYKISAEDITVIHDDLDIPLGEYRITKNRSSAGHKGVQSVIDTLRTKDFTRIRIGIGIKNKPLDSSSADKSLGATQIPTKEFVLENFAEEEQKIIDGITKKVCGIVPNLLRNLKK